MAQMQVTLLLKYTPIYYSIVVKVVSRLVKYEIVHFGLRREVDIMVFNHERITQFLKDIREDAELTQIEMAEKLNMSQSHISKYEKGRKIIDLETFMRWVQVTNSEVQAMAVLFGTDIFNTIAQSIPLIPAFIQMPCFFN